MGLRAKKEIVKDTCTKPLFLSTMTGIVEHRIALGSDSSIKSSANSQLTPPTPPTTHSLNDEVDNIDYRFEQARLQSFENWPLPYIIEPKRLAAAGFYYTGEDDKVRCFECRVEICQWVEGDNPMVDHQRWSARCRFIRKINCGNVPIGVDPNTVLPPRPRSRDVCGLYGVEYRHTSGPDNHNLTSELQLPSTAKLSCLGLARPKGPVHPEYASYDARLRTFETWPKAMAQTKEQLADAGFYYTGKGDQTVCYYCGGGLKDWELGDEPWEQHAKWFSKCYYLMMVKDQDYVNKVTGQHISPPSKEETMQMNLPSFIKKVQPVLMSVEMKEHAESNPCPSSQSCSADSGIERIGSVAESVKESIEDLSNAKTQNNKTIDDARMCKICYNEELGVLFLPCRHIVACVKCALGMTTCVICREPVTLTVRAFVS
ncbi:death-associated inhibitor of apoptosis 1-like [Halictus rubicundus]|uniref:death-associated inhibitor of apoptosis 1-like n=1 Tax=Halictus rubicundus TaxID=77578 RepID=UPI00403652F4